MRKVRKMNTSQGCEEQIRIFSLFQEGGCKGRILKDGKLMERWQVEGNKLLSLQCSHPTRRQTNPTMREEIME